MKLELLFILLLPSFTHPLCCCKKRRISVDASTQTQVLVRRVSFILAQEEDRKKEPIDRWVTTTPSSSALYVDVVSDKQIEGKK